MLPLARRSTVCPARFCSRTDDQSTSPPPQRPTWLECGRSTSASVTYSRFFGIRRAILEKELRSVVAQDIPHHVTLLASIDNELIGLGEFVMSEKPDEAEVAFAVADDHHREGVATLLLERLAVVARRCGLKQLVAQTLPGNTDMLLVFRTVGLAEQTRLDGGVVDVTLDLSTLDHLEAEAEIRHQQAVSYRRDHEQRSNRALQE